MENKHMVRVLMSVIILSVFFLDAGCTNKTTDDMDKQKNIKELHEKIDKLEQKKAASQDTKAFSEEQLAVADACSEKYSVCMEKCNSNSCEKACLDALSACEKDLPLELRTIK